MALGCGFAPPHATCCPDHWQRPLIYTRSQHSVHKHSRDARNWAFSSLGHMNAKPRRCGNNVAAPHRWRTLYPTACPTWCAFTLERLAPLSTTIMSLNIPWLVSRWGPWLCLVVVAACLLRLYNPNRKHMPPRVKAWPILNHTLMHVKDDPTEMLKQWAKEYGEIFRTRSGVTDFIWLNSREAVKELFDRRSAIYSSRQPMPMALDAATCVSCVKLVRRC